MANLTLGTVVPQEGAQLEVVTSGYSAANGDIVYRKASDLEWYPAEHDVDAETAAARGMVIDGATDGNPMRICTGGIVDSGTTLTAGKPYVVSATAGRLADAADLGSGDYISPCAWSISAALLRLDFRPSGLAIP